MDILRADDFLKEVQAIGQAQKDEIERHNGVLYDLDDKLKRLVGIKPHQVDTVEGMIEIIVTVFKRIGVTNEKFS